MLCMTKRSKISLLAILPIVLAGLFVQSSAFFSSSPGIVPDELTYMRQSFFFDPEAPGFGNYLHSLLFSQAQACGEVWYGCVKVGNGLFNLIFAVSLSYAGWVATRSWKAAVVMFVAAWFGAMVMFGSYFMPDSMFASLVAVSFALILQASAGRTILFGALSGAALAAAMLTKPHGFFLFLGLLAFAAVLFFRRRSVEGGYPLRTLIVVLPTAIVLRSMVGFAIAGSYGLNPLAGYASFDSLFGSVFPSNGASSVSGASTVPTTRTSDYSEALISGVTNLAPGILILLCVVLVLSYVKRVRIRDLFRDQTWNLGFVYFASFLLMASAFGAYLELGGKEETIFRTLTRYWEFGIGFLLVGAFSIGLSPAARFSVMKATAFVMPAVLGLSAAVYIWMIPQGQTSSDSSLMEQGSLAFIAILVSGVIFSVMLFRSRPEGSILAMAAPIIILGLISNVGMLQFATSEKAGVPVAAELIQIGEKLPSDLKRVTFVGESSAANTAAFMARLPEHTYQYAKFYSRLNIDTISGDPRWVVVSREVFVTGDYLSKSLAGDMVIYERGYPAVIRPSDFEKYGVNSTGIFLQTYWGSWVEGVEFTFTIPEGMRGSALDVLLLVNDELSSQSVSIDFGDGPVFGELLAGQLITPVTLNGADDDSWAGREVKIRYEGPISDMISSNKQLAIGMKGFSVYSPSK
jgi:hypothetical protein